MRIAISEPVLGFDENDIRFTNIRLPQALSLVGTRPNGDWWIYTFNVEPEPAGGETTITVPAGIATDEVGNSNTASQPLHIARNRKVSVADARATEGTDARVDFVVTLDARNDCETATVDWATADGTAIAGTDYAAASGDAHLRTRGDDQDGQRLRAGRYGTRERRNLHTATQPRLGRDDHRRYGGRHDHQ